MQLSNAFFPQAFNVKSITANKMIKPFQTLRWASELPHAPPYRLPFWRAASAPQDGQVAG